MLHLAEHKYIIKYLILGVNECTASWLPDFSKYGIYTLYDRLISVNFKDKAFWLSLKNLQRLCRTFYHFGSSSDFRSCEGI